MFFNYRYPVLLFILGLIGMFIGLSLKILHWQGGQLITGSMIMVQGIALLWLIIILIRGKVDEER